MKGSIYVNNGYWWYAVRLPGEKKRRARKLCAPGSDTALHADRARDVAISAARKIWEDATRRVPTTHTQSMAVDAICGLFVEHCSTYYRHQDGSPTSETRNCLCALRVLREMFGKRPAAELQHADMLAVRDALTRRGLCRNTVNGYLDRIRRMWTWALDEGYISATHKAELTQVKPLAAFRSEARESDPVKPVPDADVEATVALLSRNVGDMVRVERLAGMRPNEVCQMSWDCIDTSRTPWIYRPAQHKTQWRGHIRAVLLGPKARAILERYRRFDIPFSPIATLKIEMESPTGRARGLPDKPTNRWSVPRYAAAITTAAKAAGVPPWSPNRLRHSFATEVRRRYGLLVTAALLGHHQAFAVTQGYSRDAAVDELLRIGADAIEEVG